MRIKVASLLAAAFSIGISQAALAADMPVKASAPVAYTYNWSGVYAGGGIGWSRIESSWAFDPPAVGGIQSFSSTKNSIAIGGHIGIQRQWSNLVLGLEVGYTQANLNDGWFGQQCSNNPTVTCQMRASNFWTIGPRIGYAQDRWLVYGTGGWAHGRVESRFITTATGAQIDSTSNDRNGWFAGVGIERAITDNIIVGLDYKHFDFGSSLHCSSLGAPCAIPSINNRDISTTSDIVLARISYKFNWMR